MWVKSERLAFEDVWNSKILPYMKAFSEASSIHLEVEKRPLNTPVYQDKVEAAPCGDREQLLRYLPCRICLVRLSYGLQVGLKTVSLDLGRLRRSQMLPSELGTRVPGLQCPRA